MELKTGLNTWYRFGASSTCGTHPGQLVSLMAGIHERSAHEKIYTNSVVYVMNDETTRKYMQSVKWLMTFWQRRYPTMPLKAVEFNSLANGSDLQALLAEERKHSEKQQQELQREH